MARFGFVGSTGARVLRMSGTPAAPRWRGRLHLAAFVIAVPAGIGLAWHQHGIAVVVYVVSLTCLFGVSASYHLLPMSPGRRRFARQVDHAMIYVYIAAAYGPFCLDVMGGRAGRMVLSVVWLGAAVGISTKVVAFRGSRFVSAALYLVLGWIAVFALPEAAHRMGTVDLALLLFMGLLYTAGAVVLARHAPDPVPDVFGYHEVWHAAVVLACACYFVVVWTMPALGPR